MNVHTVHDRFRGPVVRVHEIDYLLDQYGGMRSYYMGAEDRNILPSADNLYKAVGDTHGAALGSVLEALESDKYFPATKIR